MINLVRRRRTSRRRGDAARARADWTDAANHYGQHVARYPDDAAIAVQWGHSLKQSGRFHEALAAYRQALLVTPDDADLLLSIAHVHKLLGDRAAALALYRCSAALDGNRHAFTEMDALDGISEEPIASDSAAVIAALAEKTRQVVIDDAAGMLVRCGDRIDLMSHNAQLHMHLAPTDPSNLILGMLTLETRPLDVDHRPRGELQLDYGDGFNEQLALVYTAGREPIRILIAMPSKLVGLRWILDRKHNALRLPSIAFDTVSRVTAEAMVRSRGPDDLDVDRLLGLVQRCADGEMGTREAAEATWSLMTPDAYVGSDYRSWTAAYERPHTDDYTVITQMTKAFSWRPSFSFIVPTYNTPPALLAACLDSLLAQTYANFEICVADDHSPNPSVLATIADYAARDARIKFVRCETNGHISAASNRALQLATGDFVVLVDHDDLVPDYTLFVIAHYLNLFPNADVLFSDEDKIDLRTMRTSPYFKGQWNRFLMYGHNMVSHLGVYRRSLVDAVGGFRIGLEGSQDYDLFLRCFEQSDDARIVHIPHVLYHWRMIPGSTSISPGEKSYAVVAAERALNDHFKRTGLPFRSVPGFIDGVTGIEPVGKPSTPLTIIIPTRDGLDVLKPCIDSILATKPSHVDILIVDNGSTDRATLSYLAALVKTGTARVLRDNRPFDFPGLNNRAAEVAEGQLLCFLNNDTEVLAHDWLDRARTLLSIEEVGIVGARLLYPDRTLQHFGIVLGMGRHGIAGTPHNGLDAEDPGNFAKARLIQEFSAVTAACLFIRKADFVRVGGFEPQLKVAYNDVDLCLKVRRLGLKVVGDPGILLIHKESRTRGDDKSGSRALRLEAEAAWVRERWGDLLGADPYYSPNLSLDRSDFVMATPPRVLLPWQQRRTA